MIFPGKHKISIITKHAVNIVLAVFTGFSIVYALTYTLRFEYPPFTILMLVFFAVSIYSIIFFNKITITITGISAGIAACSWLVYLAWNKLLPGLANTFLGFVSWNYNYIYGYEEINEIYRDYTFILLIIVISLIIYLFTVKRFNFLVLLSIGMGVFVIQWVLEYALNYVSFYMFIFLIIQYYFQHIYFKKSLEPENDYAAPASFMINILPICAAIFIFSLAIPKSEYPIEWEWLDRQVNKIYNFVNENFKYTSYEYFSFHSTGFGQDEGRLGGKVKVDKTPVLKVETSKRIYLKGACKDFYTGYSWINSNNSLTVLDNPGSLLFNPGYTGDLEDYEQNQHFYEALEPLISLYIFSGNNDPKKNFLEEIKINITYLNLSTKTLFTPLKLQNIVFQPGTSQAIYIDDEGIFSFEKRLGKGYHYTLSSYGIDYSDNDIKNILRKSRQGFYNNMPASYRRIIAENADRENIELNNDYIEMLSERAARIYDKYLQVPPGIPERIVHLSETITSEKDNDYDKIKSIEEYLSRNYAYTLKPRPTPKDRDFVDYFLFDLKEGYCTYFATSMVILSRLAGVPARYVEGYILPPEPEAQNIYRITNQNAHAWVEAYFEGFGWVSFEPTAPFAYSFYRGNETGGTISDSFYDDPYYLEYMEMLEMYAPSIFDGFLHMAGRDAGDSQLNFGLLFIWMVVVLFAMLILLTVINLLKRKHFLNKIKRMPPKKSIIEIVGYYIKILSDQGYPMAPGETPLEYSERINKYFIFEKYSYKNENMDSFTKRVLKAEELYRHSLFVKTMELFVLARYSPAEITQKQKESVLAFYDTLIAEIKDNLGIIKYFVYRHLLGRI
jgi:transglutaminase-like putative cysteine protease